MSAAPDHRPRLRLPDGTYMPAAEWHHVEWDRASDTAILFVHGFIGHDGNDGAEALLEQLANMRGRVKTLHLYVSSPGGDVGPALALRRALKAHPARVETLIDGYVMSAAVDLALAGDVVRMSERARLVVHGCYASVELATAAQLRTILAEVEEADAGVVERFAARTGATPERVREWLELPGTIFDPAAARAHGFVDEVVANPPHPALCLGTTGEHLWRTP